MNREEASKRYHRIRERFLLIEFILDLYILIFVLMIGLSFYLRDYALSMTSNPVLSKGIYISLFAMGLFLFHLPFKFVVGFVLEHKFHLSNQSFFAWIWDKMKELVLSLIVFLILIEVIYALLGSFPSHWWIGAGLFWVFLTLFMAKIMPTVIIPLFYKYEHVEDQDLRERIFSLFKECGVKVSEIYSVNLSAKTQKANAFVCGLGKSRRVVLSDTLLKEFSADEIITVVAHELGHYVHRDILKSVLVNAAVVFSGFYAIHVVVTLWGKFEMSDIAYFPLLLLLFAVMGFIVTPFLNWFSRQLEKDADQFSLAVTKMKNAFVSMMTKLGEMNLADFSPGFLDEVFYYDHPSIAKRIKFAEKFYQESQKNEANL